MQAKDHARIWREVASAMSREHDNAESKSHAAEHHYGALWLFSSFIAQGYERHAKEQEERDG